MDEHGQRGIIDSKNRMIDELLGKTTFKDALRQILNSIDPENSPQLVRTLLGRDIEVPLSVLAAIPSIANAFILAFDELLIQINGKFPPQLIADLVESLVSEIDTDALARLMYGVGELNRTLSPILKTSLTSANNRPDKLEA